MGSGNSTPDFSVTLAMDTCGKYASVALLRGGQLVEETVFATAVGPRASARILADAEMILARHGLCADDLTSLVVTTGPGSFTGVRIALSCAKGLVLARPRITLVGVCSLDALAYPVLGLGQAVLAALNAQKGQVYAALYDTEGNYLLEPAVGYPARLARTVASFLRERVLAVGDGTESYEKDFKAALQDRMVKALASLSNIRASCAALAAMERPKVLDPVFAEPLYLRVPEAEARLGGNKLSPKPTARKS